MATQLHELLLETQAENRWLREDLSAALVELASVRAESSAQLAALTEQIGVLTELVAKGNERIAELLAAVERKRAKANEERAAATESPPAATDPAVAAAFAARPQPPPPSRLHDRPRPKQRPTGRKPLSKDLPADERTVYPKACGCGCTEFDWVDEVVEEKLDIRAHKRIRRTRRVTGRCKDCARRTTAEAPPSPFPRSKLTPESLAYVVVQAYRMLVPANASPATSECKGSRSRSRSSPPRWTRPPTCSRRSTACTGARSWRATTSPRMGRV